MFLVVEIYTLFPEYWKKILVTFNVYKLFSIKKYCERLLIDVVKLRMGN